MRGKITPSEKDSTQEKVTQTNVRDTENVSRETLDAKRSDICFKELYRAFRNNKLSRFESAYNAAYLYCNDKYYTSGAQLKEHYRNIYAHPGSWFRHGGGMWRHNKWSAAVKLLELLPAAKRSASTTARAAKPVKRGFYSVLGRLEYGHMEMKAVAKFLYSTCLCILCLVVIGATVNSARAVFREKTPLVEVYVNGEYVGLTDSVVTVDRALRAFEESESILLGRTFALDCSVTYKPVVENRANLMQPTHINDVFRKVSLENMTEGYGLYVDGDLVCATLYKNSFDTAIRESLDKIGEDYKESGISLDNVSYYNDMSIVPGMYPNSVFSTNEEIREMFSLSSVAEATNKTEVDGTVDDVSVVKGALSDRMPIDESGASDVGDASSTEKVPHSNSTVLNVIVEKSETVVEPIPYGRAEIKDPTLAEGKTVIDKKGANGSKRVIYTVGYLEDEEVMRIKLTEEVISLPVPETVIIGTRPLTEEEKRTMSTGTYIIPTTGLHSSGYGWRILGGRNEFHKGVDIASSYGTDIVASDGGEVIHARHDNSGYGLSIQILHDNGEVTRYAHCSKVYVEEGQRVGQGELIAAMGSTGYVTGTHLHFEVLKDGKTQNPENYFEY